MNSARTVREVFIGRLSARESSDRRQRPAIVRLELSSVPAVLENPDALGESPCPSHEIAAAQTGEHRRTESSLVQSGEEFVVPFRRQRKELLQRPVITHAATPFRYG